MAARGAARDVRVEVAPGTIGVKFEADYNGNCAVVKRFMVLPSGQESPLKRHVQVGFLNRLLLIPSRLQSEQTCQHTVKLLWMTMTFSLLV